MVGHYLEWRGCWISNSGLELDLRHLVFVAVRIAERMRWLLRLFGLLLLLLLRRLILRLLGLLRIVLLGLRLRTRCRSVLGLLRLLLLRRRRLRTWLRSR